MRSPTATSRSPSVVLQFVDLNRGFALAADVDERHFRANRDDRALEGLALLEALRLDRSLEHRGEVFVESVMAYTAILILSHSVLSTLSRAKYLSLPSTSVHGAWRVLVRSTMSLTARS